MVADRIDLRGRRYKFSQPCLLHFNGEQMRLLFEVSWPTGGNGLHTWLMANMNWKRAVPRCPWHGRQTSMLWDFTSNQAP